MYYLLFYLNIARWVANSEDHGLDRHNITMPMCKMKIGAWEGLQNEAIFRNFGVFVLHKICLRFSQAFCSPQFIITKTYLYNFDPRKSHFYIVKLGFTELYIILFISAQKHFCGYSLKPPHRGGSNEY